MVEHAATASRLQEIYREAALVRPRWSDPSKARQYYSDYVGFVGGKANGKPERLLDVGCGSGWSTLLFRDAGFDAVGLDVTLDCVEVSPIPRGLTFAAVSAMEIPFAPESFDVVCSYQTIEHVPDPRRALEEFDRVLLPGGTVYIVGPNLISPLSAARSIIRYVWRNRPLRTIFVRAPEMPRHPAGNTLPELVVNLALNSARIASKLASRDVHFSMRTPDTREPFYSDNDACYLCNPVDLARFYEARGYEILRTSKAGRPPWISLLATGTWFAARKPAR